MFFHDHICGINRSILILIILGCVHRSQSAFPCKGKSHSCQMLRKIKICFLFLRHIYIFLFTSISGYCHIIIFPGILDLRICRLPIKSLLFIVVTSFPGILPCKHFSVTFCSGLSCFSPSSPAVVSDCLCCSKQVTDHKAWSAAHHRECHYDSARSPKRKVMAELLLRLQGALIGCQGSTKEHSKTSSNY